MRSIPVWPGLLAVIVGAACLDLPGQKGGRCNAQGLCVAGLGCRDGICRTLTCPEETDQAFCQRLETTCGPVTGVDTCGETRTVDTCGRCTAPQTCGGGGTAGVCGCASTASDADLCAAQAAVCGAITVVDDCGVARTIDSCGDCTAPETCGGGGIAGACGCISSQTDADLCAAQVASCGTITVADDCGVTRTARCGDCTAPETCGGGGNAGACGCTSSRTDADLCAAQTAVCGAITVVDDCGVTRTVDTCGTCPTDSVCGASAPANTCGGALHVEAGLNYSCALLYDRTVRCWGLGDQGQLGYGNTNNVGANELPADVGPVAVGGPVTQIGVGGITCVLQSGDVRCWGIGEAGRLGQGSIDNIGDDEVPSSVPPISLGGTATQIAVGWRHACALLSTGDVRCWGDGALTGYGDFMNDIGDDELPSSVGPVSLGGVATQITAGSAHTCALLASQDVICWGFGTNGVLGYGNTDNVGTTNVPSAVGPVPVGGAVQAIAAGVSHTCALLTNRQLRCWGSGLFGALGYGNTDDVGDDERPSDVGSVSVGDTVQQVALGTGHTCALVSDGQVRCWGSATFGQLGYGNTNDLGDDELPSSVGVVSVGGRVAQISAGNAHTCALLANGDVKCWGISTHGQLGYGNTRTIGDGDLPSSVGAVRLFP